MVSRETGKPLDDARIEGILALDHLHWAAKNAAKVLGPRNAAAGLLMVNHKASVEYPPMGVVGVLGPWNYPVFTPMGSIVYALAAGNTVVFKPSELTPGVGKWLVDSFAEAVGEDAVFQLITGEGETGAALCRAGVDKLAFTGSTATAKKVMATCAETLTPVLVECGGKDALLVDADADLDDAAAAVVWGAMSNAGQTCVGVERVYVVDAVAEDLLDRVAARAATIAPGGAPDAHYGPITMPSQLGVISGQIDDALVPRRAGRGRRARLRARALRRARGARRRPRGLAPRSPTRPSGPPWWSTASATSTRPSTAPTPRATASAPRCSPRPAATRSPAGCAPAWCR